jgi:hypothetical protein
MLKALLTDFSDVFYDPSEAPGITDMAIHSVPTGDHPPIQKRQNQVPSIARVFCRDQLKEMLDMKLVRPSKSPWRSPIVIVKRVMPNKRVKFRFCIDLRKANEITVKDSYSLPRINETADALAGPTIFSTMEIERAFNQVPIAEEDIEKFAFMVDNKLYEPVRIPFGSMNAPATFFCRIKNLY